VDCSDLRRVGAALTGKLDARVRFWYPSAVVLLAMVAFTAWFSLYTIRLHEAHLTHKKDLGQIDLATWNTSQGRLLQEIKDDQVSTRLTDHVELIFVPASLVFRIWDDVRALLVLQAAALALGAWPIYLFAQHRLAVSYQGEQILGIKKVAAWGGAVLAIAYLLTPALQAAAVSEFHALPLSVPLIAWALWAVERRRWGWFTLAALLLLTVQEGMALLGATLGVCALIRAWRRPALLATGAERSVVGSRGREVRGNRPWLGIFVGAIVFLLSLAWFYVTTFLVIPHFAAQVYGIEQTPYIARYGALGDSIGDVLRTLMTQPGLVLSIVLEPLRARYMFGLLVPTAFLALLGPGILLISSPLLLANLLSSYPLQYSGELHYSAPLVPYLVAAAAIGLGWLWRLQTSRGMRSSVFRPALWFGPILVGALFWQIMAGYTPLGREFWRLAPGGWPQITAHERLLDRFAAQIPAGAPLSVTTDLYPHLSHRQLIYQFPWLGQASWVLVDVSGTTDENPRDVRAEIERLLSAGWGVVDAADGYILLAHRDGEEQIPDRFYDFARTGTALPQHTLDVTFGDRLKLVGYDVLDNTKWRRTSFRFYWEALTRLPEDTVLSIQMLTPAGAVADDTAIRPMPAVVWYPPAQWRPGETVVTETLPWYLPREWAPVITVRSDGGRLIPVIGSAEAAPPSAVLAEDRLRLQAWARRGGRLEAYDGPDHPNTTNARFSALPRASDGRADWTALLTAYSVSSRATPGQKLPVMLRWQNAESGAVGDVGGNGSGAAPTDYTVFVHLRSPDGRTIASSDGMPTWFTVWPTSRWKDDGYETWDTHGLSLPADLPAGTYDVVVGWYNWKTGDRLDLTDDHGNPLGNELVLTQVSVDAANALQPDLCCTTVAECCASQ
jgi:uncharacterized membrane protein